MVRLKRAKHNASKIQRMLAEYTPLRSEFEELFNWCFPNERPCTAQQAEALAREMMAAGFPFQVVQESVTAAQRRPRKRPASKRTLGYKLLELRLTEPRKWTWAKLTATYCDCGKPAHTFACRERVRRLVGHIKRFLKAHSISVTP
jgi:hypothetical protein